MTVPDNWPCPYCGVEARNHRKLVRAGGYGEVRTYWKWQPCPQGVAAARNTPRAKLQRQRRSEAQRFP